MPCARDDFVCLGQRFMEASLERQLLLILLVALLVFLLILWNNRTQSRLVDKAVTAANKTTVELLEQKKVDSEQIKELIQAGAKQQENFNATITRWVSAQEQHAVVESQRVEIERERLKLMERTTEGVTLLYRAFDASRKNADERFKDVLGKVAEHVPLLEQVKQVLGEHSSALDRVEKGVGDFPGAVKIQVHDELEDIRSALVPLAKDVAKVVEIANSYAGGRQEFFSQIQAVLEPLRILVQMLSDSARDIKPAPVGEGPNLVSLGGQLQ